jgi:hypothetical protein
MPRKPARSSHTANPFVNFNHNDHTYQIDPERRKVYRRFVELETSKAAEIFATWRSRTASA